MARLHGVETLREFVSGAAVTLLHTLVPREEPLRAEACISNEGSGFVHPGQTVRHKFPAFPLQKYGIAEGSVKHVSAEAIHRGMPARALPASAVVNPRPTRP
ncbi:MAG: hypothetical protein JNM32_08640 [Dechloromonas sp.]|jgi:hypothetical protein|nr:hypothetical protein [Dechloromonas sp.]